MNHKYETIIVGGGQAGLATSYHLCQRGLEHIVLEAGQAAGEAWRNGRWDSFCLVTPNWTVQMPGAEYRGSAPGGYMPREALVHYFERYVQEFQIPVRFGQRVLAVELEADGSYRVTTAEESYEAANVVMATGLFQRDKIPPFSAAISPRVTQLPSGQYRNPAAIPPGAVLVVGSGQSGCQIAEELYQSGRQVYLCTGGAGRVPRRYRGRDIVDWMELIGWFDRAASALPSPAARFGANPQASGRDGGHSINLHQFARDGVNLLGRLQVAQGENLRLAADLKANLEKGERFEAEMLERIDAYIERTGIHASPPNLPELRDGYDAGTITELDLAKVGINTVIWAMGYDFDFNLVKLPVFDEFGYPRQEHGATQYPGLYFVGLPWLTKMKSGLLMGVGEDAALLAATIREKARQ